MDVHACNQLSVASAQLVKHEDYRGEYSNQVDTKVTKMRMHSHVCWKIRDLLWLSIECVGERNRKSTEWEHKEELCFCAKRSVKRE